MSASALAVHAFDVFRVSTPFEKMVFRLILQFMQHTLTLPPSGSSETESSPIFNILIAYHDLEAGKHAKMTYDYLQENLGRECTLTNQMWKFEVLSIPKLREIAIKDATQADIIIISGHGDELPEPVIKWTESWLMEETSALALVALFDRVEESSSSPLTTRSYLAEVAKRGGMEFFAQPDEWPGRSRATQTLGLRSDAAVTAKTFSTLAGAVHRDVAMPHWGINE